MELLTRFAPRALPIRGGFVMHRRHPFETLAMVSIDREA